MSARPLTPLAEEVVHAMHLKQQDQAIIRHCVSKYSQPSNFCDTVKWIVYRITNAIKNVFGVSDWQIARKTIQSSTLERVKISSVYQQNPQNPILKKKNSRIVHSMDLVADGFLTLCCLANEKNIELNDDWRQEVRTIDLEQFIERLTTKLASILAKAEISRMSNMCSSTQLAAT